MYVTRNGISVSGSDTQNDPPPKKKDTHKHRVSDSHCALAAVTGLIQSQQPARNDSAIVAVSNRQDIN